MPSLFCIAIWEAYGYNIKKRCVRHRGKRGCAMARYQKIYPQIDTAENTFNQIYQYLIAQGFQYVTYDGQQLFKKGDGIWVAPRFVKVTYLPGYVQVEAWIEAFGSEQGLEGFVGSAVKGPIKKAAAFMDTVLTRPGVGYVPEQKPVAETTQGTVTYCAKCATPIAPNGRFCPKCGHPVGAPIVQTGIESTIPAGVQITKQEFYKKYAGEKFKRELRVAAIIGYVLVGINLLVSILMNPYGLIDCAVLLGLLLGMHLGRSKGCAIALLAYSIFSSIVGMVSSGTLTGWAWIAIGVSGVILFANTDKRYRELMQNR